jgi:hypothetical protein
MKKRVWFEAKRLNQNMEKIEAKQCKMKRKKIFVGFAKTSKN